MAINAGAGRIFASALESSVGQLDELDGGGAVLALLSGRGEACPLSRDGESRSMRVPDFHICGRVGHGGGQQRDVQSHELFL